MVDQYPSFSDYSNETGFLPIMYAVRDSITIVNPFFIMLMGVLLVLTVGSYYTFNTMSGRTRFFNSLLASSFAVTVLSIFFSLAELVTPYHVLTFIGVLVVSFVATIWYK